MQVAAIAFDRFKPLQDDACETRIVAAKAALGKDVVILGHHYQRADVYKHADLTGDSLQLSRLAGQTDADYIVCAFIQVVYGGVNLTTPTACAQTTYS